MGAAAFLLFGVLWSLGVYFDQILLVSVGAFAFGALMGLDVSLDPYDKEPE